jgi:hypothetical protein
MPLGRLRRRWEDNIKRDLQEVGLGAWTRLIWLRIGCYECGIEPPCSIKCKEVLGWLRTSWLLKKDSFPWSYGVMKIPISVTVRHIA